MEDLDVGSWSIALKKASLDLRLSDSFFWRRKRSYTVANDHAVIRAAIDRGVPIDEIKRKSAIGKDLDTLDHRHCREALGLER